MDLTYKLREYLAQSTYLRSFRSGKRYEYDFPISEKFKKNIEIICEVLESEEVDFELYIEAPDEIEPVGVISFWKRAMDYISGVYHSKKYSFGGYKIRLTGKKPSNDEETWDNPIIKRIMFLTGLEIRSVSFKDGKTQFILNHIEE